jgi:hypothetical protein
MPDEEFAAREYTETWCKDGEIGYVVLNDGARVRTCAWASGLLCF